ncbi:hypothetical protein AURDEDRAFT_188885 [Auricularia subglabra TFB-10046 SS5]|uniref:F-box domain-containing protein n=1 Tax=Auricularia subglabra (strain TFB-10046 / SS5) TaxID=717982 RepID=J0WQU8_AURST|nr:hypothetical protein AURDEDRAFT_188885 [Auricularia subglabra TFB-10046 SS5]
MSSESTIVALAAIHEALGSLQRFSERNVHAMANAPDLEAQLNLASKNTSTALLALEAMAPMLRPPSRRSPKGAGSLPDDVLAEVFKVWFEMPDSHGCSYRRHRISPGYAAASVNRRWRAVAVAIPSIWTRTVLDFAATTDIGLHIGTLLTRSKSLPLDVKFLDTPRSPTTDEKLSPNLVNQLAELVSKCTRLSISWRSSHCNHIGYYEDSLLPLLQASMPQLESLVLGGVSPIWFFADRLTKTRLLTLCPNLRVLDLDALPLRFIEATTMRLRSFHTRASMTGEELARLQDAWPMLSALDIRFVRDGRPVVFPELRTLTCHHDGIFRCIPLPANVPCLQYLSIPTTADFHEKLTTFLDAAPCASLRVLVLRTGAGRSAPVPDFARLFPSLPQLRELRLVGLVAEEVRCLFAKWNEGVHHPPLLDAISLSQCSIDGAVTRALVNFLALRNEKTGSVLASLSIVQQGLLLANYIICSAWMRPRLEQLVQNLHFDVDSALVACDRAVNAD